MDNAKWNIPLIRWGLGNKIHLYHAYVGYDGRNINFFMMTNKKRSENKKKKSGWIKKATAFSIHEYNPYKLNTYKNTPIICKVIKEKKKGFKNPAIGKFEKQF